MPQHPSEQNTPENRVPVSVIIPCFRCTKTIGRAVDSILQQTAKPIEIILVDDFSGDDTHDVLLSLQQSQPNLIKVVALKKNEGAGMARNAGWEVARQPYIAFLDADDSWHQEKLALQHAFMEKTPDVSLCGHLCTLSTDKNTPKIDLNRMTSTLVPTTRWLFMNAFSTPTVMLKRDLPLRFESGQRYCEDFLLWQSIAFSGHLVARLEVSLACIHKPIYGAGGLSGELWKMEMGELDNFLQLWQKGYIGPLSFLVATSFSLMKFSRRCLRVAGAKVGKLLLS